MHSSIFESFTATAYAAEAAEGSAAQPSMIETLIPFAFIFVLMYFLMIRPQVKKAKEHATLLKNLKVGDEVITTGGILGRVRAINNGVISLDLGSTHIRVAREHIQQLSQPLPAPSIATTEKS
ncbi:MAG: preprotein translocase subunit YajC [Oligoflexales bacterium]|nr:preprotein translocase subunit YajC [Oligoflexales bacterium]